MAEMQGNVPQGTNTLQNPDCVISTNHPSAKVSMTWPRPMSQGVGKRPPSWVGDGRITWRRRGGRGVKNRGPPTTEVSGRTYIGLDTQQTSAKRTTNTVRFLKIFVCHFTNLPWSFTHSWIKCLFPWNLTGSLHSSLCLCCFYVVDNVCACQCYLLRMKEASAWPLSQTM